MIIYFYLLITTLQLLSIDSVSIRGRHFRDDLVPYLNSRLESYKKDPNSLKVVSNDPFIIQFQVPENWEKKEGGGNLGKEKKDKRKRPLRKRIPLVKAWRKRHRIRRDIEQPDLKISSDNNGQKLSQQRKQIKVTKLKRNNQHETNQTSKYADQIKNSQNRQEIYKTLNKIKKESKNHPTKSKPTDVKTEEGKYGLDKLKPRNEKLNRTTDRNLFPSTNRATIFKLTHPAVPKSEQVKNGVHEVKGDYDKIENKIKNWRNLLKVNNSASGDDGVRVRRKTESDKLANKIAKMFLTLSAVNGMNDKKKSKCKDDDDEDDLWQESRRTNPTRRNYSTNEERYKVKKWIENLKNKRSGKTCPCVSGASAPGDYYDDPDVFPLEQKLGRDYPLTGPDTSSEESLEIFRSRKQNAARRNRNRFGYLKQYDDPDRLKTFAKRGRRKFELPIEDLETYRSRAKQILQNAEEILEKLKEEEEKRLANPNAFINHLKELTTKIQGDPRNSENDFIKTLQKNLGMSKGQGGSEKNSFIEGMKTYVLDPYEKAKALTDESTKQLTSYLLKNLANVDYSGEEIPKEKETDEVENVPVKEQEIKTMSEGIPVNSENEKMDSVTSGILENPRSIPSDILSDSSKVLDPLGLFKPRTNEPLTDQESKIKNLAENPNEMSEMDAMKHLNALEDVVKDFAKEAEGSSQGPNDAINVESSAFDEALKSVIDLNKDINQEVADSDLKDKTIIKPVDIDQVLNDDYEKNTKQVLESSPVPENENTLASENLQPKEITQGNEDFNNNEKIDVQNNEPYGNNEDLTATELEPAVEEKGNEEVMKSAQIETDAIDKDQESVLEEEILAGEKKDEEKPKTSADDILSYSEKPKPKSLFQTIPANRRKYYKYKKPNIRRSDSGMPLSETGKTADALSNEDLLEAIPEGEKTASNERINEPLTDLPEKADENVENIFNEPVEQTLEALEQKLEGVDSIKSEEATEMQTFPEITSEVKEDSRKKEEDPKLQAENLMASAEKENLETPMDLDNKENYDTFISENRKETNAQNINQKDENNLEDVPEKLLQESDSVNSFENVAENHSEETPAFRSAMGEDNLGHEKNSKEAEESIDENLSDQQQKVEKENWDSGNDENTNAELSDQEQKAATDDVLLKATENYVQEEKADDGAATKTEFGNEAVRSISEDENGGITNLGDGGEETLLKEVSPREEENIQNNNDGVSETLSVSKEISEAKEINEKEKEINSRESTEVKAENPIYTSQKELIDNEDVEKSSSQEQKTIENGVPLTAAEEQEKSAEKTEAEVIDTKNPENENDKIVLKEINSREESDSLKANEEVKIPMDTESTDVDITDTINPENENDKTLLKETNSREELDSEKVSDILNLSKETSEAKKITGKENANEDTKPEPELPMNELPPQEQELLNKAADVLQNENNGEDLNVEYGDKYENFPQEDEAAEDKTPLKATEVNETNEEVTDDSVKETLQDNNDSLIYSDTKSLNNENEPYPEISKSNSDLEEEDKMLESRENVIKSEEKEAEIGNGNQDEETKSNLESEKTESQMGEDSARILSESDKKEPVKEIEDLLNSANENELQSDKDDNESQKRFSNTDDEYMEDETLAQMNEKDNAESPADLSENLAKNLQTNEGDDSTLRFPNNENESEIDDNASENDSSVAKNANEGTVIKETPEGVESAKKESQEFSLHSKEGDRSITNDDSVEGPAKSDWDEETKYDTLARSEQSEDNEGSAVESEEKSASSSENTNNKNEDENENVSKEIDNSESLFESINQEEVDENQDKSIKEKESDDRSGAESGNNKEEMDTNSKAEQDDQEDLLQKYSYVEPKDGESSELDNGVDTETALSDDGERILNNVNDEVRKITHDEKVEGKSMSVEDKNEDLQKGENLFANPDNTGEAPLYKKEEDKFEPQNWQGYRDPKLMEQTQQSYDDDKLENKFVDMDDNFYNSVGNEDTSKYVESTEEERNENLKLVYSFEVTDNENSIGDSGDESVKGAKEYPDYYRERAKSPLTPDQLVKAFEVYDKKPRQQKPGKMRIPHSIGKIMKDLDGGNKEDMSIQNLDPERIDLLIDKLEEADEQEQKESEEVDCMKECACAEDIKTISRNRGRYEIMKDVLLWMKDMQLNRVLNDD